MFCNSCDFIVNRFPDKNPVKNSHRCKFGRYSLHRSRNSKAPIRGYRSCQQRFQCLKTYLRRWFVLFSILWSNRPLQPYYSQAEMRPHYPQLSIMSRITCTTPVWASPKRWVINEYKMMGSLGSFLAEDRAADRPKDGWWRCVCYSRSRIKFRWRLNFRTYCEASDHSYWL